MPLTKSLGGSTDAFTKAATAHSSSLADTLTVFQSLLKISRFPFTLVLGLSPEDQGRIFSLPPNVLSRLLSGTNILTSLPEALLKILRFFDRPCAATAQLQKAFGAILTSALTAAMDAIIFLRDYRELSMDNPQYNREIFSVVESFVRRKLVDILVSSAEIMDASFSNKIPLRVDNYVIHNYVDVLNNAVHLLFIEKATDEEKEDAMAIYSPGTWIWPTFKALESIVGQSPVACRFDEAVMETVAILNNCAEIFSPVVCKEDGHPDWAHFARSTTILAGGTFQEYALGMLEKASTWSTKKLKGHDGPLAIFLAYTVLAKAAITEAHAKNVAPNWSPICRAVTGMVKACMDISERSEEEGSYFSTAEDKTRILSLVSLAFHVLALGTTKIVDQSSPAPLHSIPELLQCAAGILGNLCASEIFVSPQDIVVSSTSRGPVSSMVAPKRVAQFALELVAVFIVYCSSSASLNTPHSEVVSQKICSAAVEAVETIVKAGLVFSATAKSEHHRIDTLVREDAHCLGYISSAIGHTLTTLTHFKPLSQQLVCALLTVLKLFDAPDPEAFLSDDFAIGIIGQVMLVQFALYREDRLAQYMLPSDAAACRTLLKEIQALQQPNDMKNVERYLQILIQELEIVDGNDVERLVRRGQALSHRRCANLECTQLKKNVDDAAINRCSGCLTVKYCCKNPCQKSDWKKGHKMCCKELRRIRENE